MSLSNGTRLGPYEILSPLGAGGMGEVYRARDTRLGREVAVKVLPAEFARDTERLRRFEQEARATAALDHPNILVLHDIGSTVLSLRKAESPEAISPNTPGLPRPPDGLAVTKGEGEPVHYIVTELLEGESLRDRLRGGPLTPAKAVEFGIQIAQGLAAAHEKGIVHRDLKPENLFVTKDGWIKILDFGLARLRPEGGGPVQSEVATVGRPTAAGQVMGTPGYMAPEQVRGLAVDHRADIFALGAVLYEMLSGRRAFSGLTVADQLSAILSEDPPPVSRAAERVPSAFDGIVRRCLEKRPEDRFSSAKDVAFALQALVGQAPAEVTARAAEPRPYPGLASFTEDDAENFFGREEEVAALWRKIPGRDLLALIGPSGAGKSSFLRAGILPHAPAGWRVVYCTPGQAPFSALGRALAPAFAGDPDAYQRLLEFHVPEVALGLISQWRSRADHGLLIVDQFEELFTLNGEDVQGRFADLLGKIASLDGVHVLLSMRDDFLIHTQMHVPLKPLLSELTALLPLSGENLHSAVVKPAATLGFAFEDGGLVDEMMGAVAGERGALPLLAFTVARLWEERDRERKLLTRSAYESLGGVSGALAKHADATLERIGEPALPVVREIFRNLTTSQQTRCVLDAEELVSVFPKSDRDEARWVLRDLVQARLLTTFEVETPDGRRHHRVEIVHESLLHTWPRLVRWRTEDEGSAQMRDQLRQAAHLWEEKGNPEDLLWTGTSFQEYQVWRERYPGGLSEVEEAFASAMIARAGRRRRLRLLAYTALLVAVSATAIVIGISRHQAVVQKHQAEAAQLLSLGRLRLADHPNAALAYAIASLERSDNAPARRFAVEVLAQGPPALFLPLQVPSDTVAWSPDGAVLATGGTTGLELIRRETGQQVKFFSSSINEAVGGFTADGRHLVTGPTSSQARSLRRIWAMPNGRLEHTLELRKEIKVPPYSPPVADHLIAFESDPAFPPGEGPSLVHLLSLDGKTDRVLGRWLLRGARDFSFDPKLRWVVYWQKGAVFEQRLDDLSAPPRRLGAHETDWAEVTVGPGDGQAVSSDQQGNVRIWDVLSAKLERTIKNPAVGGIHVVFDPRGRHLATSAAGTLHLHPMFLWDLSAPKGSEPVTLVDSDLLEYGGQMAFSPDGSWLASLHGSPLVLWNTARTLPVVLGKLKPPDMSVAFTPDGHLLASSDDGVLKRWPLSPASDEEPEVLLSKPGAWLGGPDGNRSIVVDRRSRIVLVNDQNHHAVIEVPLDGKQVRTYPTTPPPGSTVWFTGYPTLDPGERFVAVSAWDVYNPKSNCIQVLDLSTGAARTIDTGAACPVWLPNGRLVTGDSTAGLKVWDVGTGTSRLLRPAMTKPASEWLLLASSDGRSIVRLQEVSQTGDPSSLSVFDLATGTTREVVTHGSRLTACALDSTGKVLVTGDAGGVVRVGWLTGEVPHLLYGHTGRVTSVAVSPDGRWIASGSDDGTIRLWPMPDLSKPPLHTLPHDELLAKLKALTNLRAVRDPKSDTGWKIEIGPFPGWAHVPEWQP